MHKEIWFDMDGTIANLYAVPNWLEMLINEDETPYKEAKPLVNMNALARQLNQLGKRGYSINIVSWLSKNGSKEYNKKVTSAKKEWLNKHLKSVKFNKIDIVKYGTPKQNNRKGILFDDELPNRQNWNGLAYEPQEIMKVLKGLQ